MKVKLLSHTADPEKIIALAAKTCYSKLNISDIEADYNAEELLTKLREMGHYSPFEHASFTFSIEGISRACSHQLVRHRIASYSQKSQRYVKETNPEFVVPESIENSSMRWRFTEALQNCVDFYQELCYNGIPEEDARYILPNGIATQLVMTMNARELIHACQLRLCNRAQKEIQELFIAIAGIILNRFPVIFKGQVLPKCLILGECPEAAYRCQKPMPQMIKDMV